MLLESWEDLSKLEKLVSTGTASVLDGDTQALRSLLCWKLQLEGDSGML